MIVFDSDDFGANHEISDMCQSHDCRDILLRLKEINPAFKATLFAIPAEMTMELLQWCGMRSDWIELGVHGFKHSSNYECEKWTMEEMDNAMSLVRQLGAFTRLFKAPGWQISDEVLYWLKKNNWMVADQAYNNERRPKDLKTYIIDENPDITSIHTHTWNCVGNGVYELFDQLVEQIRDETEFMFVSEAINA